MRLIPIALAAVCAVSLVAVSVPARADWDHGRNWSHGEHHGDWRGHRWGEREQAWGERHWHHHHHHHGDYGYGYGYGY